MSNIDILKQKSLNNGQIIYLIIAVVSIMSSAAIVYYSFLDVQKDNIRQDTDIKNVNGRVDRKHKQQEKDIDELKIAVKKLQQ